MTTLRERLDEIARESAARWSVDKYRHQNIVEFFRIAGDLVLEEAAKVSDAHDILSHPKPMSRPLCGGPEDCGRVIAAALRSAIQGSKERA